MSKKPIYETLSMLMYMFVGVPSILLGIILFPSLWSILGIGVFLGCLFLMYFKSPYVGNYIKRRYGIRYLVLFIVMLIVVYLFKLL